MQKKNTPSSNNPCPFLRSLVQQGLLTDGVNSISSLTNTILDVAEKGEGSPKLIAPAIRAIAVLANGIGPVSLLKNTSTGVRLNELRQGPLDKKGAGSRILSDEGKFSVSEFDRLKQFASEKNALDGTQELGLDASELKVMMDANYERSKKQNRGLIDRRLMDGEWPILLKVMGKESHQGRYLSLKELKSLFKNQQLPDRILR